jgi:hypothetical protein
LRKLGLTLPNFQIFDKKFQIQDRVLSTFDELDGYTHTRGYKFSSTKLLNHSNVNQFESESLQRYCDLAFSVIKDLIVLLVLKYPIGMQVLPLDEKFGLNDPAGGFLPETDMNFIQSLLPEREREVLQELSDNDVRVQQLVEFINSMPDLTEEQWKAQIEEWDKIFKEHGGSDSAAG